MPYSGSFRLTFDKIFFYHLKRTQIFQNAKFHAKLKIPNLGPKLPYSVVLGISFIICHVQLPYLKYALSNSSKYKASCKTKNLKFETKNTSFGLLRDFEENKCHI